MSKLRAMLERHARVMPFAIAAISLLAHVHFIVVARGLNFRYDSHEYIANAKHLGAGDGFLNSAGEIESRRRPAYPFFLSTFYSLGLGVKSLSHAQHLIVRARALEP